MGGWRELGSGGTDLGTYRNGLKHGCWVENTRGIGSNREKGFYIDGKREGNWIKIPEDRIRPTNWSDPPVCFKEGEEIGIS